MPRLRISAALSQRKNLVGSFLGLEKESGIDRRKLKAIVEKENFTLSFDELQKLEQYLGPLGESLALHPLFLPESPFAELARPPHITLYVGARPYQKNREFTSVWDVEALGKIIEHVNTTVPGVTLDIRKVPSPSLGTRSNVSPHELNDRDTASCAVGSPLACQMTEITWAKMCDLKPFTPKATPKSFPFRFVWFEPEWTKADRRRSSFEQDPHDLGKDYSGLISRIAERHAHAFILKGKVYPVDLSARKDRHDYGVVIAKRGPDRTLRVAVGGVSGPGTLAAASAVGRLAGLGRKFSFDDGDLVGFAVECSVGKAKEKWCDDRVLDQDSLKIMAWFDPKELTSATHV